MILFSWPVDRIVVDFTLPGHWRNTVFIFTIDFITSFGQQYRILLLFFSLLFFCLFAEISFCWAESTQPLGRLNPTCSSKLLRAYWLLLANRSERMPAREACRINVV